jgi:hypothetical protein
MMNEIEIKRDILHQVAKGLSKEIKTLKTKIEFEKECWKYDWKYDGWDDHIKRLEAQIDVLIQQKIKHERWRKLLKHQLNEQ